MATDAISRYDTETVERALWALALHAGSPKQASEALQAQGINLPRQTLHRWKVDHAERYQAVCDEASDQLANRIATEAEQFMLNAARVELKALERLEADIDAGEIKDVASALRNITTAKALNNDKVASPLRGRATVIHGDKTGDALLKELRGLAPGLIVNGTAEEVHAEPVAELPAST